MKKGFTLIELLAVIVILAIIALIATPIILNIVEDSKKSAVTNSAQLYVDGLQNRIASENMTREFNPSSCNVTNGNITCDGQSLDYTVDGQAPTSGTISFNNGVISGYTLCISDYKIIKTGNNITSEKEANCVVSNVTVYTLGQLLQYDPVNNEICTSGSTCYKWRVITANDTTSNTTITLQMDHNLINTVAWVTPEDYDGEYGVRKNDQGPITALQALETATSTWDDSLKLNYSYDTSLGGTNTGSHYGTLSCVNGACTVAGSQITSNLKARMITGEEVRALTLAAGAASGTKTDNWTVADNYESSGYYFSDSGHILGTNTYVGSGQTGSTTLSWLIENTSDYTDSGATSNAYGDANCGYWTLSPIANYPNFAWSLCNQGMIYSWDYDYIDNATTYGARPVITLPKSIFE